MGCGGSKVDDLPLVTLCKERKELIKAASEHRYALAAAHVSYFRSMNGVGDALRKFVDEELVIGTGSSSPDSPVLTLPSDEGKRKKKTPKTSEKNKNSSSSTSISHSIENTSPDQEDDIEGSHLHLSSRSESESRSHSGHIHISDSPDQEEPEPSSSFTGYYYPPPGDWSPNLNLNPNPNPSSYMYYMKRSAPPVQSVVYEDPERHPIANVQWPDPGYGYSGYGNGGVFGFSMGSPPMDYQYNMQPSPQTPQPPPAPPSPPRVSTWDFLNVFDNGYNGYPGYYPQSKLGFRSSTSSPDSKEVREREGIPDLEDETEQEMVKEIRKEKKILNEDVNRNRNSGEGTSGSRAVPLEKSSEEKSSKEKEIPMQKGESSESVHGKEISSSPDTIVSEISEEEYVGKKRVSFEAEERSVQEIKSSKPSSLAQLSVHGIRDLQEVVKEIRDEFETASSFGKEVAVLLEVGKLPYQPKGTVLKGIFSRILYLVAPSMLSSHTKSRQSVRTVTRTMKMAKAYYGDAGKDFNTKSGNLSSTLEKLYAWEKKLYKEVKDEERLRVIYEKKCKTLKILDDRGAESSKIDATQASIRKLLTKINVCIGAVDAISGRIHKLRDEELQPQLTELIHGLIRMWKSMLKCHQKQFQAIMESKARSLRANTGLRRDSSLRATLELEMELVNWCARFNEWINGQKSYVESLNGWLLRCLLHEPEETPDGIAPFSPSRVGAPPVFVICNDWHEAMERISEKEVANAMHDFASNLHQLWEKQDEEQRQRIKSEYLSKDFEKRLRTYRLERGRIEHDQDASSDKTAVSVVPSESGVSPLDDLKVDLDSMRKRLDEERARHKETVKLVHNAASSSIQAGLIPIFKALGNFTSEALKAHEQVRT